VRWLAFARPLCPSRSPLGDVPPPRPPARNARRVAAESLMPRTLRQELWLRACMPTLLGACTDPRRVEMASLPELRYCLSSGNLYRVASAPLATCCELPTTTRTID